MGKCQSEVSYEEVKGNGDKEVPGAMVAWGCMEKSDKEVPGAKVVAAM